MIELIKPKMKAALGAVAHALGTKPYLRTVLFNAMRRRSAMIERLRSVEEVLFLAHVFRRLDQSSAQILQDLWVWYELDGLRDGFFVEFGATNGRTNSNTWLLEHRFGWKGILAEPNVHWHADLKRNRSATIDTRCVAETSGQTVEFLSPDDPELSTMVSYSAADHFADVRRDAPRCTVETISLEDLLVAHAAPTRIDYMSVDTEGSELEILSAFDFGRWDVRLLSVEHNNTGREQDFDKLLAPHGYVRRFPEFSQWDAWYVKR